MRFTVNSAIPRSPRGRIVKTTGDGLLVEFASVVDAVRCAVEVQREMIARNAGVASEKRIEFRVGIHQGDIIVEDGDIFGDGVNLAAYHPVWFLRQNFGDASNKRSNVPTAPCTTSRAWSQ